MVPRQSGQLPNGSAQYSIRLQPLKPGAQAAEPPQGDQLLYRVCNQKLSILTQHPEFSSLVCSHMLR